MKAKNLDIYGDAEKLERLSKEYEYLGFTVVKGDGKITVLTVKPRKQQKRKQDEKPKRRASKRPGARV